MSSRRFGAAGPFSASFVFLFAVACANGSNNAGSGGKDVNTASTGADDGAPSGPGLVGNGETSGAVDGSLGASGSDIDDASETGEATRAGGDSAAGATLNDTGAGDAAGEASIGAATQDASQPNDTGSAGGDAENEASSGTSAMDVTNGDANPQSETGSGDATMGDAAEGGDASCVTSQVSDYCAFIPALPAAPVIDGVLDCGPAALNMVPQDWSGAAPLPSFPEGNAALLAAAWRADGLYVFIAVTTPAAFPANAGSPPYDGAGVELFVDSTGVYPNAPSYNDPGTIQLAVEAPSSATGSTRIGERYRNAIDQGPWSSTQFATFPTPSGFNFEGFVAAADLGLSSLTLASGDTVGFDIAVDVSFTTASMTGADGHRVGQYFLHVGSAPPYSDPRSFCAPTLTTQ
jgi:hypothetical protein